MKTVIVVDTDDPKGMESTRRIVDNLLTTYHHRSIEAGDPFSGKIQFIKHLRAYVKFCEENWPDDWQNQIGNLKTSKGYADTLKLFQRAGNL